MKQLKKQMKTLGLILIIVIWGWGTNDVSEKSQAVTASREIIHFNPDQIEIDGDLKSFKALWETEEIEKGLQIITLTLKSPAEATPPEFALKWNFPSVDIYSFWNSNVSVDKVNYYRNRVTSRASSQAPVISFFNSVDINRLTFACSDALNKISTRTYLREEDAKFYCSIRFFDEKTPALKDYRVRIRIDTRDIYYYKALKEWNPDGFKLDFIGFFSTTDKTIMTATSGRDYASVNEAVDRLMTDIMGRLKSIKPSIMIEFRQTYIGPLMRKYGNMFRATDCPNNAIVNRVRTTDVRLLCGSTAAHSDMFTWHNDEPVDVAALQILNILFSVPQLSVRLDSVPEHHLKMIKFWINYWKENRHVLLEGDFIPVNPGALYPMIKAKTDEKTIIAVYNDMLVSLDEETYTHVDVVNAKTNETIVLDLLKEMGEINIRIYDCLGNMKETKRLKLKKGLYKFTVPSSRLLSLEKL